jgi:hypothetical protein
MPEEQLKLLFDTTLTKQHARERGYHFIMDLALNDKGELDAEMAGDIQHMVNEEGYKIGQPETPGFPSVPYGLYKPVKKTVQPQKTV